MKSNAVNIESSMATVGKQVLKRQLTWLPDLQADDFTKKMKLEDGSSLTTTTSSRKEFSDREHSIVGTQATITGKKVTAKITSRKTKGKAPVEKKRKPPGGYPWFEKNKTPTVLRMDRPVKTGLPREIWENILGHCEPEFLHKIARRISETTREILMEHDGASEKIWKLSRLRTYGNDHPDPPTGESDAVHLYATAFPVDSLLPLQARLSSVPSLSECIPAAQYDSWPQYLWVGDFDADNVPSWAVKEYSKRHTIVYSSKALTTFIKDLEEFFTADPTTQELAEWLELKAAASTEYVKTLQAVEDWYENDRANKTAKALAIRTSRKAFFLERAASMDPPMVLKVLQGCKPYREAVSSKARSLPTERVWVTLSKKLETERHEPEKQLYKDQLWQHQDELEKRRENYDAPEQMFLLELANKVMQEMTPIILKINISDIGLFIFSGVYKAYQESEKKPEGMFGQHRLLMADARMIYEMLIIDYSLSEVKLYQCPGCPDDYDIWNNEKRPKGKGHSFMDLMDHILLDHEGNADFNALRARRTNALLYEEDPAEEDIKSEDSDDPSTKSWHVYPYNAVEWPRNLPLLPSHKKSTCHWDLNAQPDLKFITGNESS
ncbi:hypothetical protein P7C71_g6172, partial [Lecanoromycetidae sp. Uapishka_2]